MSDIDKYSREYQRQLLQALYDAAPFEISREEYDNFCQLFGSEDSFASNLIYLEGHGLITNGIKFGMDDYIINLNQIKITHRGIDFIRNDGGLGAILNVQTIKFHDSTIIALEDIIRVANLPDEKKAGMISKLRELPADAIKHLTLQLLTPAVLHPLAVIQSIEKFLQ
ncbi:hypothetical protein AB8919_10985 [Yersinia enterocolitica]|uniref:hypothetical protein n=1 Tax=Yersinia TaxID=629 RepID=UPI001D12AF15|nr:hypothetical protein [Yersinia proxima]